MTRSRLFAALVILALLPLAVSASLRHFELDHSVPEDGATVSEVSSIGLWFTQVPQDSATTVRLIDSGGALVETGALTQSTEDRKAFSLAVPAALNPGSYRVSWRSMAPDGHVVRDEFGFTVSAR